MDDAARVRVQFIRLVCVILAGLGWANVAILGTGLMARRPPAAGFDLELVLNASRRVAAGLPLYQPAESVRDLFYAYPPFVAQAMTPIGGLPTWVVLTGQIVGAVLGLVLISALMARHPLGRSAQSPVSPLDAVIVTMAVAPFFFPLVVSLLFGNLDAWFPLLLGAAILALPGTTHRRAPVMAVAGGVAIGLATAAKISPVLILFWVVARALAAPSAPSAGPARRQLVWIAAGAVVAGAAIGLVSLLEFGIGPWGEYVGYFRQAGALDPTTWVNIGPASLVSLLTGNQSLAQPAGVLVALAAVVAVLAAARHIHDDLQSVTVAIVASMVFLPVTWYHYPVALIPSALAIWMRSRGTARSRQISLALVAAWVLADVSIVLPVGLWLAVGVFLWAVSVSTPEVPTRAGLAPDPAIRPDRTSVGA